MEATRRAHPTGTLSDSSMTGYVATRLAWTPTITVSTTMPGLSQDAEDRDRQITDVIAYLKAMQKRKEARVAAKSETKKAEVAKKAKKAAAKEGRKAA